MSDNTSSEDARHANAEDARAESARRISPRGERHGWMPDECDAFEQWDGGSE